MYDELENGDKLDLDTLSELFGFPIIPTVSSKGTGIDKVMENIVKIYENLEQNTKHIHINYGKDLENAIDTLKQELKKTQTFPATTQHVTLLLRCLRATR